MARCLICHKKLPIGSHRNRKLCGSKDCLMEQQRRSGRKSYHKLLGHTEPEKRNCVVCQADITGSRGNRIVCKNPDCKKEIKRRGGYAYFNRNRHNPTFQARNNELARKYRAAKPKKERKYQLCKADITHMAPGAKICSRQACHDMRDRLRSVKGDRTGIREHRRPVIRRVRQTNPITRAKPSSALKRRLMATRPTHHRAIVRDTIIRPFKPVDVPVTERIINSRPEKIEQAFIDHWCCAACQNAGTLCDLHQSMTDKGIKPVGFAYGSKWKVD